VELARLGFNRLSMGVQDFEPRVQVAINRVQPYEDTRRLVEQARALGFPSVNMDLIFGLPFQTAETFSETIDKVVVHHTASTLVVSRSRRMSTGTCCSPHHCTRRRTVRDLPPGARPSPAPASYIGMDHFARPTDELARADGGRSPQFQGYTTRAGTDLIGFGMSAISGIRTCQSRRDLGPYQQDVAAHGAATFRGFRLSEDDRLRRTVIQNLLCHGVIVKSEIESAHGIRFDEYFAGALEKLEPCAADGLVALGRDEIRATTVGRVFLRNLAMPFDAYLTATPDKPVFSKTL
jgi:oxygen-independent coproporphyrinogen-3 oxidase